MDPSLEMATRAMSLPGTMDKCSLEPRQQEILRSIGQMIRQLNYTKLKKMKL